MQYKILGIQPKSADWKILELEGLDGTHERDVSVNRTNKDGSAIQYADFDNFAIGSVIDGNVWTNPTNSKKALYPSKPKPAGGFTPRAGGARGPAIEKAMDRKEASIEKFATKKEESIAIAGAFRDATLITLASLKDQPFPTDEEFKEMWKGWVKWMLDLHEQPFI